MAINEASGDSDRKYREAAASFADSLSSFLEKSANLKKMVQSKEGGYLLRAQYIAKNHEYSDLVIFFGTPSNKFRAPTFGMLNGRPIIMMPVLLAPGDLRHLGTRFDYMKSSFVHEFIHFLDKIRYSGNYDSSKSGKAGLTGDFHTYINSPEEFNAHFQQGVYELEKFVKANKTLPRDKLERIFPLKLADFTKEAALQRFWSKELIKHMDSTYRKKFLKRVVDVHHWYVDYLYGSTHK